MKNPFIRSLFGLALVSFTLFSCDKLEEADDVEFDIEVDVIFSIDENGTHSNIMYASDPVTLSLAGNAEVQQYLERIKEVRVKKVEYSIANYVAEPPGTQVNFSNGYMQYGPVDDPSVGFILSNVATANLATLSGVQELPINQAGFDGLAELLLEEHEATVHAVGQLSSTPVQFNIPTTFTITIVADAL